MNDIEQKQKFITLRAKGYSLNKIANDINKCRQTLANWNNELEEEISNLKAIELESLFEECFITKEYRIKNLFKLLSKIDLELDRRDLKDVSTEKLIDLKSRLSEQLKSEFIDVRIKSDAEVGKSQQRKNLINSI
jgi:DNA-binding transcriptional MerR regulator